MPSIMTSIIALYVCCLIIHKYTQDSGHDDLCYYQSVRIMNVYWHPITTCASIITQMPQVMVRVAQW